MSAKTATKEISPMRAMTAKLNANAKSKIESLRKTQAEERKALRQKHKDEALKIRTEGKTQIQTLMQKMLNSLMESDMLKIPVEGEQTTVIPVPGKAAKAKK